MGDTPADVIVTIVGVGVGESLGLVGDLLQARPHTPAASKPATSTPRPNLKVTGGIVPESVS